VQLLDSECDTFEDPKLNVSDRPLMIVYMIVAAGCTLELGDSQDGCPLELFGLAVSIEYHDSDLKTPPMAGPHASWLDSLGT